MEVINNVGNEPLQSQTVLMQDGRSFDMILEYKDQQLGWFMSITYKTYTINNIRVVTSGNLLYQWRNLFNFGIACETEQNQEPQFVDDFQSGRSALYVLTSSETADYARVISGEISP